MDGISGFGLGQILPQRWMIVQGESLLDRSRRQNGELTAKSDQNSVRAVVLRSRYARTDNRSGVTGHGNRCGDVNES